MSGYEAELRAHYERVWGAATRSIRLSEGPLWELPPKYAVLEFPPLVKESGGRSLRYATVGMSQPEDDRRLEVFIESPLQSHRVVDLLNLTAHFHRTGERLGLGHTVNFGSPWIPESKCVYGLLSLPYLDGPSLEKASALGNDIRILWLIPITKAELEYKKQHGLDALEEAFERANFNYLEAGRPSVV